MFRRAVSANLKKCGKSRTLLRKLRDFKIYVRDFQFDQKDNIFEEDINFLEFIERAKNE